MPRYLDPKNDLTFKRIFGEHKHLCMSLLNSMLPLETPVVSIEYLSPELVPEIPERKNSIVDVRCKDKNGRQFIVEMQMYWTDSFTSRVLFNASKAYVKQLKKRDDYSSLQPVYALAFVNEIFEQKKPDEYYYHYKIVNIQDTEEQIKGLEFVFIELPKFKPSNRGEKKLHELWLGFLNIEDGTREIPEDLLNDAATSEALEYLEAGAYTEAEMDAYEKYWDIVRVEKTLIADGFNEGKAEGKAEGEAERQALEKTLEKEKTEREKEKTEREKEKAELEAKIAELEKQLVEK